MTYHEQFKKLTSELKILNENKRKKYITKYNLFSTKSIEKVSKDEQGEEIKEVELVTEYEKVTDEELNSLITLSNQIDDIKKVDSNNIRALEITFYVLAGLSGFGSFVLSLDTLDSFGGLVFLLSGLISALFMFTFGVIIKLLNQISINTKK